MTGRILMRLTRSRAGPRARAARHKSRSRLTRPSRRFLSGQGATRLVGAGRVDGVLALLDVADDAFLVDGEGGARAVAALLVEDAVVAHRLALEVAQQREGRADVLLEAAVGGGAVYADAQDLR